MSAASMSVSTCSNCIKGGQEGRRLRQFSVRQSLLLRDAFYSVNFQLVFLLFVFFFFFLLFFSFLLLGIFFYFVL